MIETIFYFANSKTEYDANANSGNISARTISFVPTGNGVGDIYKNGIKYGSSIDEDELIRIINEKIADIDFNIPFASTSKAGIIKLGKGLKSVGNDGTVDVDFTGLNGTDGIDGLDGLVENILKTIIDKNGVGVDVNPLLNSGTPIANITVGTTTKTLFAPAGSGDGSGSGSGSGGGYNGPTDEEVDEKINQAKQDLQEEIDAARNIANEEKQRLTDLINTLDSEIQTKFENMLDDVSWMQEHWPEGSGSTSNFGLQDVEEYLQMIGVWDENEDHTKSNAKWSKIAQKVDTIELAVNALSSDGNITEALQSSINQAVQDGVASLNLETMYAKKDDTEKIVEWLTSGFRSATSSTMTYNDIVSAAKNGDRSAISNLYSKVEEIDGKYVARSGVESMVDNAITGLVNNTNGKYSQSQLYSAIGTNAENIAAVRTYVDNKTSKASIVSAVGDVSGGLVTKATYDSDMTELQSKYDGMQGLVYTYVDNKIAQAGLVASSDLEGYVKKAQVIASINDSGESNVKIDADKINVAGITIQGSQISDVGEVISDIVTTNYIKGKLGTITVDANNINLNGQTNFLNAIGDSITVKKLSAGSGSNIVSADSSGITVGHSGNFDIDGSGSVANGHISWDESGNVSIKNATFDASTTNIIAKGLQSQYISINPTGDFIKIGPVDAYPNLWSQFTVSQLIFNSNDGRVGKYSAYSAELTEGNNYTKINLAGTDIKQGNQIALYNYSGATVEDGTNTSTLRPTGVVSTSDMRLKDIIADKNLTAEQIATAPVFTYNPKNDNTTVLVGTSAQYWQDIVPEAISELNGYLALDYSKVATVSTINLAKEVVTLKSENTTLKQRVEALEARLQLIENKLNAQ